MELNTKFTSEELKGFIKQPEDSCPHLNEILLKCQNADENFEKDTINFLDNATEVIDRIKVWQNHWQNEYLKNKSYSEDDDFIQAYTKTANYYKKDLMKINFTRILEETKKLIRQYQDEINIKNNKEFLINNNEKADVYMSDKKKLILENVEEIRSFASLNRKVGQFYKDSYKHISYEHDFNDLIQPIEIIREEQGNDDTKFNLGIINHKKTFENLIKNNYFEDHEIASFRLFNNDKIENLIVKRIKEKHPEIKDVIYYNNIEDYRNKKGYNIYTIIRPEMKNNLKNKI